MTPLLSSTLLRTQSDARLLALASRGYERAFEAIVERYRRPLHRWCRQFLPEARAEDAVQTAFLKAWSSLREGTEVGDLKPWLYRIARNAALDNARKAGYDYVELTEALRLAPAPEEALERRRVMRETLTGVAGLPANQREALLRTAAGHSRAEIARELDVSEGAVRQLVHRARTALRAAATVLTPLPFASWAAAMGSEAGAPTAQRIAELAAGAELRRARLGRHQDRDGRRGRGRARRRSGVRPAQGRVSRTPRPPPPLRRHPGSARAPPATTIPWASTVAPGSRAAARVRRPAPRGPGSRRREVGQVGLGPLRQRRRSRAMTTPGAPVRAAVPASGDDRSGTSRSGSLRRGWRRSSGLQRLGDQRFRHQRLRHERLRHQRLRHERLGHERLRIAGPAAPAQA